MNTNYKIIVPHKSDIINRVEEFALTDRKLQRQIRKLSDQIADTPYNKDIQDHVVERATLKFERSLRTAMLRKGATKEDK